LIKRSEFSRPHRGSGKILNNIGLIAEVTKVENGIQKGDKIRVYLELHFNQDGKVERMDCGGFIQY
jgi:transcription antitermination factor NusG